MPKWLARRSYLSIMYLFLYFVIKTYPTMRTDQRAFVVHLAQETERTEQGTIRPTDIGHITYRQRPQEHDERTVSIGHSLPFDNLYWFQIGLFYKYTKGIRTEYFLCMKKVYLVSLVTLRSIYNTKAYIGQTKCLKQIIQMKCNKVKNHYRAKRAKKLISIFWISTHDYRESNQTSDSRVGIELEASGLPVTSSVNFFRVCKNNSVFSKTNIKELL